MIEREVQRNGAPAQISDSARLTVHNPMGYPPRVTPKDMAPRLETLEGKKVFLVTAASTTPTSS
jgi:hypothetical protein